ncbi:MAG: hypothetical protein ACRDTN_03080 [Mycobacterium sp.]
MPNAVAAADLGLRHQRPRLSFFARLRDVLTCLAPSAGDNLLQHAVVASRDFDLRAGFIKAQSAPEVVSTFVSGKRTMNYMVIP